MVEVFKCQPVGDQQIPDMEIVARETLPDADIRNERYSEWEEKAASRFRQQADLIFNAMVASLPGGTIHSLTVRLLEHKRSLFVVRDEVRNAESDG